MSTFACYGYKSWEVVYMNVGSITFVRQSLNTVQQLLLVTVGDIIGVKSLFEKAGHRLLLLYTLLCQILSESQHLFRFFNVV